jgi:hypothetical protein
MVTECSEVFSDDQPCENSVVIQRFRDGLRLHHQKAERVPETLDYNAIFTWLITQEYFTAM